MAKQIKNKKNHSIMKKKRTMRIFIVVLPILLIIEIFALHRLVSSSSTKNAPVSSLTLVTDIRITTITPEPYETPHIISYESNENEIRQLKRRMITLGWMKQNSEITGDFDVDLQNAIHDMKEYYYNKWNSTVLGDAAVELPDMNTEIVDEKTWSLIFDNWIPAPTIVPSPTITSAPTRNSESLGIWSVDYYVDDFGDKTDTPFLSSRWINGTFSNTATTDSPLKARIYIDHSFAGLLDISIRLDEYANGHIENMSIYKSCSINVKDNDGEKTLLQGYCGKMGISLSNPHKLHDLLMKEGTLKFVIKCNNSKYEFTINNADGYNNAFEKLVKITPFIRETSTPKPTEQ